MSAGPIRIALVDDHRIVLDSFRSILDLDPAFEVVGTATTAEAGRDLVLQSRPDVALFDLQFSGLHAFDVLPQIHARHCRTKVVILTAHLTDAFVHQAILLDAAGYLLKQESAEFVRDALKQVARGRQVFSSAVKDRIVFNEVTQKYESCSTNPLFQLSIMQLSILRHLAGGKAVKEIAKLLDRSEKSIDSHKYRIMHRLGVHDRVELCRYAIREGVSIL
ncbi:MAG: response regulator transcription factor [Planctomycetota bacterium]|nr:response regulator transcription factor [Planctomycetota bacterium]